MEKRAVFIGAWVLTIVAILHLFRVFFPASIVIGKYHLPIWASMFVFIFAGTIAAFLFRASRNIQSSEE